MKRSLCLIPVLILLPLTCFAAAHKHHHTTKPTKLTADQIRCGFTSVAYASAYDELGHEIMRENSRVQEVAESKRDSENGYYVMMKSHTIPHATARRICEEVYDRLVAIRSRYYDADTASRCSVSVRTADDDIVCDDLNGQFSFD